MLSIRWPDLRPRGGVTPGDPRRAFRCTRDRVKPLVGARVEWCGLSAAFVSPDFSACLWLVALSRVCLRPCVLRYGDVSYHLMLRARDTYDSCVGHGATWLPDREPSSPKEPEVPSERSDRTDERKIHSSSFDLSGRLRGQGDNDVCRLDYRQRHRCIAFDSSLGVNAM